MPRRKGTSKSKVVATVDLTGSDDDVSQALDARGGGADGAASSSMANKRKAEAPAPTSQSDDVVITGVTPTEAASAPARVVALERFDDDLGTQQVRETRIFGEQLSLFGVWE